VNTDEQLVHLTRYIHNNPSSLPNSTNQSVANYPFSSLRAYLGKQQLKWIKKEEILDRFSKTVSSLTYENFLFAQQDKDKNLRLEPFLLDYERTVLS
jgi:hypothetical protein